MVLILLFSLFQIFSRDGIKGTGGRRCSEKLKEPYGQGKDRHGTCIYGCLQYLVLFESKGLTWMANLSKSLLSIAQAGPGLECALGYARVGFVSLKCLSSYIRRLRCCDYEEYFYVQ